MAGNYDDVPAHRIAYDRDGSRGFKMQGSTVVELSSGELEALNDEDSDSVATHGGTLQYIGIIFADKFDVVGWHASWTEDWSGATIDDLEWSTNTTSFADGTWNVADSNPLSAGADQNATRTQARQNIQSVNLPGCKALRFKCTGGSDADATKFQWMHFYGGLSSGEAPDRLRFWDPSVNSEVDGAFFDWGDTQRSTVSTKTFRIHNPSSLTAQDVTLSCEALTDTTPDNVSQHTFSDDGTNFSSTLNIGNLAPGATSGVLTVKREVPSNAQLSVWFARIVASASAYV